MLRSRLKLKGDHDFPVAAPCLLTKKATKYSYMLFYFASIYVQHFSLFLNVLCLELPYLKNTFLCNIWNAFTVTFDLVNVSLLNKSINLFKNIFFKQ